MVRSQLPELFSTPRPREKESQASTSQATHPTSSSYPSQFKYTASIWDESRWQHTQNKPAEAGTPQIVCVQYLDNDPRVATLWPHPILPYILRISQLLKLKEHLGYSFPTVETEKPREQKHMENKAQDVLDRSVPLCENKDMSLGLISTDKRSPASKRLLPHIYTAPPPSKVTTPSDISTGSFFC